MPTDKPSRRLYYSEEELQDLRAVFDDLSKVGRRGRPEYLGQKVKFNDWLRGLTAEGAARARQSLADGAAAPMSGTVERPMPTKKTTAQAESVKAAPPSPRRGRPPGRKKITASFSLDPDVAAYAKALGSPKVNDLLRRSMRAAQRKSG